MENSRDKESFGFKAADLISVPNILTYLRLILVVPFLYFFLEEKYIEAAVCIGISGLTDCMDGFIARRFNQITSLGKILDPIADKITLLAVAICMAIYVPVVLPVMIVLFVKDFTMLMCGLNLIRKKIIPPAAKWYGKVGTIIFYITVCLIVFLKAAFNYENYALDFILLTVTAVAMIFALIQYGRIYFSIIKESKKNTDEKII